MALLALVAVVAVMTMPPYDGAFSFGGSCGSGDNRDGGFSLASGDNGDGGFSLAGSGGSSSNENETPAVYFMAEWGKNSRWPPEGSN